MNVLQTALTIGIAAVALTLLLCGWRLLRGPTINVNAGTNPAIEHVGSGTVGVISTQTGTTHPARPRWRRDHGVAYLESRDRRSDSCD